MAAALSDRESDSQLRRSAGFRASLPGVDLATLLQLVSMSMERRVVQVSSGKLVGYLYMSQGRPWHAALEGEHGESSRGLPAALQLLALRDGDVSLVERPFPPVQTLDMGLDELLLRAATAQDEAEAGHPAGAPTPERGAVIASVRLDEHGRVVSSEGRAQHLTQLVAYVIRISATVAHHLALAPFSALEAELGSDRVMVFVEGAELVGVLLREGRDTAALRKQLGL